MSWALIIVLIIVGLLFLVLEILVVPGTTLVGIAGFLSLAWGIYGAYQISLVAGHTTLVFTLILTCVTLYYSLRSKTWNKMKLSAAIDGKVNVPLLNLLPGDEGVTVSRLAPMGKAKFKGEYFEVQARDEFIDQNISIVIVKVEFNKIIVKKKH